MPSSLADRHPDPPVAELIAQLAPPPRFAAVRFSTYTPADPSQAAARDRLAALAAQLTAPAPNGLLDRLRRRPPPAAPSVYLDGGFGVGKTHLLASLWHAVAPGAPAVYSSFRQLVALVGALSMQRSVEALRGVRLLCVDEFELDDPANTRLIGTLLRALVDDGASVVATSNTLPSQLGEGRFDTERFRREIESLAEAFQTVRVEGEDYRARGAMTPPSAWEDGEVVALAHALGARATLDKLDTALGALTAVHPVRYPALVDGLAGVFLVGGRQVDDLNDALRLAYLVDVLYDGEVPVALSGVEVGDLFAPEFLRGGYAKLLGRAVSRLGALLREADALR